MQDQFSTINTGGERNHRADVKEAVNIPDKILKRILLSELVYSYYLVFLVDILLGHVNVVKHDTLLEIAKKLR